MVKKLIITLFSLWIITAKAQLPPYVIPNIDWINYFSQHSALVSSAVAIDVNSNVYSTGYYGLTTSADLIAIKYDSLGTMTYSYSYNNGNYDLGKAIKVDLAGNAYIAGVSYAAATLNDFYVVKLSPTGTVLWSKRLDNANKNDEPYDLTISASGNVYVTGKSTNSHGDYDIWTVALKYNSGLLLWQNTYAGVSGLNDNGVGVVLSSNNSTVYVTGNTSNTTHGSDIITFALNASNGATLTGWPVITDGTSHGNDYSDGIIRCGSNIVICGETNNTTTGVDHTTIKYNGLTGAVMWTKKYDFLSATNRATSLARDSADHIGVVGTAMNGSTMELHTILYDSLGNQMQVNKESTGLSSLAADPKICNDTIAHHWYVVGSVMNASQDILVYQITPTGNTSWRKSIDGQNYDYDLGTSIGVNGVGVVYVGAHSKNSTAQYDYTTIKINQTPYYFPPDLHGDSSDLGFQYWKNQGQLLNYTVGAVPQIKYYTMSQNPRTYLEPLHNHFVYTRGDVNQATNDTVIRVDMDFINANTFSDFYPMQQTTGYMNFYLSHLPLAITGAKGSKRLIVPNIYPNVDLHYYSSRNGIKYYFVLKQGIANLRSIQIRFSGQHSDAILNRKLVNDCYLDSLKFSRPICYQVDTSNHIITSGLGIWKSLGSSTYGIDSLTNMITPWPVIIEIDVNKKAATTAPTTTGIN